MLGIGGLGYPIDQYLPSTFLCVNPKFLKRIVEIVEDHNGPVTIIGFSWGAERALEIACSPLGKKKVDTVIAHSPGETGKRYAGNPNCRVVLYSTAGDRLCEISTIDIYKQLRALQTHTRHGFKSLSHTNLPFSSRHKPNRMLERFMYANKHQFVNALPDLERLNWGWS